MVLPDTRLSQTFSGISRASSVDCDATKAHKVPAPTISRDVSGITNDLACLERRGSYGIKGRRFLSMRPSGSRVIPVDCYGSVLQLCCTWTLEPFLGQGASYLCGEFEVRAVCCRQLMTRSTEAVCLLCGIGVCRNDQSIFGVSRRRAGHVEPDSVLVGHGAVCVTERDRSPSALDAAACVFIARNSSEPDSHFLATGLEDTFPAIPGSWLREARRVFLKFRSLGGKQRCRGFARDTFEADSGWDLYRVVVRTWTGCHPPCPGADEGHG